MTDDLELIKVDVDAFKREYRAKQEERIKELIEECHGEEAHLSMVRLTFSIVADVYRQAVNDLDATLKAKEC